MRTTLLVALGGVVGALCRWWLADAIDRDPTTFPWETFAVNMVGCLAIGLAARRLTRGSDAWFVLVTGLLGGLTTFSTFALEARDLVEAGRTPVAAVYTTVSVLGGWLAVELARGPARR